MTEKYCDEDCFNCKKKDCKMPSRQIREKCGKFQVMNDGIKGKEDYCHNIPKHGKKGTGIKND